MLKNESVCALSAELPEIPIALPFSSMLSGMPLEILPFGRASIAPSYTPDAPPAPKGEIVEGKVSFKICAAVSKEKENFRK